MGKGTLLCDALTGHEDWREIVIVLEREQSDVSGELLRRLVLPPEIELNGQSVDGCVAEGLQRAQSLRRPTVITLINTQWIDAESAEALLRICTLLRDAAILVLMSGRPSARPEVNRGLHPAADPGRALRGSRFTDPSASAPHLEGRLPGEHQVPGHRHRLYGGVPGVGVA
ncbi:hypothetical protein [Nesterenkonia sp. AN1]|uniref:hypothetical protein n=1 Tax=Nesterenkonia sp. AN1 TaxID=652017 RepID=UPI0012694A74|nr:hypothetical protein [Nesterenkonia sp. AN1]